MLSTCLSRLLLRFFRHTARKNIFLFCHLAPRPRHPFASPFINCFPQFISSRSGPALLKLRVPFVSNFAAPPMRRTPFLRRPSYSRPCISSSLFDLACHPATFSPFIFFQVAAYIPPLTVGSFSARRRPFIQNVSPLSTPPRRPSLTYFLSLHYFYIYSLVARTFFHRRHYVGIPHLFIPAHRAYVVLFPTFFSSSLDRCPYAVLCLANACSNIKKYSESRSRCCDGGAS